MVFENGVKNIQTAAYNGTRMEYNILKNCKAYQCEWNMLNIIEVGRNIGE